MTSYMNMTLAGFFGGWEIVLILAVVLILFGAKKLPELARGLGQGIKEFKKATREVSEEIQNAISVDDDASQRVHYPPQKSISEATQEDSGATVAPSPNQPKA